MSELSPVQVEVLLRIDGSLEMNRLMVLELPIRNRFESEDGTAAVEFDTRVLIKTLMKKLKEIKP